MTEEELLRCAAKAAGIKGKWHEVDKGWFIPHEGGGWLSFVRWDPLNNDYHALRLVVKLNLSIAHSWTHAEGIPLANVIVDNPEQTVTTGEIKGDDPYDATRKAIVRAAAEIGKAMK